MLLRMDISDPCAEAPFLEVLMASPWKTYTVSEHAVSIFDYTPSIVMMYTHEHCSYLIIIIFAFIHYYNIIGALDIKIFGYCRVKTRPFLYAACSYEIPLILKDFRS